MIWSCFFLIPYIQFEVVHEILLRVLEKWKNVLDLRPSQLHSVAHSRNDSLLLRQILTEQLSSQNKIFGQICSFLFFCEIFDLVFKFVSGCCIFVWQPGGSAVKKVGWRTQTLLSQMVCGESFSNSWSSFAGVKAAGAMWHLHHHFKQLGQKKKEKILSCKGSHICTETKLFGYDQRFVLYRTFPGLKITWFFALKMKNVCSISAFCLELKCCLMLFGFYLS